MDIGQYLNPVLASIVYSVIGAVIPCIAMWVTARIGLDAAVVRAEVEDLAIAHADLGPLRAEQRPLLLVKTLLANLAELGVEELFEARIRGLSPGGDSGAGAAIAASRHGRPRSRLAT